MEKIQDDNKIVNGKPQNDVRQKTTEIGVEDKIQVSMNIGCNNAVDKNLEKENEINVDDLDQFRVERDKNQYNFCSHENIFSNENEIKCECSSSQINQHQKSPQKITQKIFLPVRILHDSIKFHSHEFNSKNPMHAMSETSFRKYIPKYFTTKANKKTDVCHICQQGKRAMKTIKRCKDEEIVQQVDSFFELCHEFKIFFLFQILTIFGLF